jgi:GNAT superfamily N-acetyltransferase
MNSDVDHSYHSTEGHLIQVRRLRPQDAVHLVDLFGHMGADSRFLRFNLVLNDPDPELVWEEAQRMARVDPEKDGAWLAFADLPGQSNAPVAGARYIRIDPETAEASLAVRDDMQRKGIGTGLLKYLAYEARKAGIHQLVGTVQRANRSILHILRKSGLNVTFESEGSTTTIVADLVDSEVVI